MKKVFILAVVVILSACGGGGAQPVAARALVQVDGYGDSTTAGLGGAVKLEGAVFNNRGVSGSSITDLLEVWSGEAGRPAKLITLNHAINSVNTEGRPLTEGEYRRQLTAFVRGAQDLGKRVILETPNPAVSGGLHSGQVSPAELERRARVVREVAVETGSPLCDQYTAINKAGMGTLEYLTDGFHPDARLYAFKAAYLSACVSVNL